MSDCVYNSDALALGQIAVGREPTHQFRRGRRGGVFEVAVSHKQVFEMKDSLIYGGEKGNRK